MRRIVKPFDWIAALFGVPAFGLMLLALIDPRGLSAGLRNVEAPLPFVEWFLFIAGSVLLLVGLIWMLATWGKSSNLTRTFNLVVIVLPVLVALLMLVFPLRMYSRGFATWAKREVNPLPIRTWLATRIPSTTPATAPLAGHDMLNDYAHTLGMDAIDLSDCPPDVSRLGPQAVWITRDGRGLLIIWSGMFWGNSRCIYLGIDAASTPPPEIKRWRYVMPAVYASDALSSSF